MSKLTVLAWTMIAAGTTEHYVAKFVTLAFARIGGAVWGV